MPGRNLWNKDVCWKQVSGCYGEPGLKGRPMGMVIPVTF